MKELNLTTLRGNYYLTKNAFDYDLNIVDLRLLLVLTSVYKTTIDELNYDQKMWIANSKSRYSKLSESEKKLINFGLIDKDGTGLKLENNYIIYKNLDIFDICKNIRQVFICSLKFWHKKGKIIVSETTFKMLFGDTLKMINKNWKRTCEQLNISCSWEKKNNNIYIKIDKENKSSTVEITSVNNESNTINTNEKQHEENKTEKDFSFLNNIGKVKKEEVIVFNGTEFTAEELDEYFRNN